MNKHFCGKRLGHALVFAGLAPCFLLALGSWAAPVIYLGDFINSQRAYAMTMLPVLGGAHWGAALLASELSSEQTKKALVWGVMPALFAWASTLAGGFAFAVLMAGFIISYLVDKRLYTWYPLPAWLLRLRFIMTCTVVVLLMLTVIVGNLRG